MSRFLITPMVSLRIIIALLGLSWATASSLAGTPPVSALPEDAINFSLLDYRGKHYELRRSPARCVVLFFTSFTCPIARQLLPRIKELAKEGKPQGVEFWLVNSCTQDDPSDAVVEGLARARKPGLAASEALGDADSIRLEALKAAVGSLPVLRDDRQLVARHFKVTRTCEVIALDPQNLKIIYRGAVDDQLTEGAQKPAPTANYLRDAVTAFLQGTPVPTRQTPAHGCRITWITPPATAPISYVQEIAPLLQKHCVGCHSLGQIGPFAMTSYAQVHKSAAMMEEVLVDRRMPPWHADAKYGKFANHRTLTPQETHLLLDWIGQNCPLDEGADPLAVAVPAAPTWALGTPDFVVPLPKRQDIPATGTLKYRYLDSEFVMPEDAWLRAAVCRAENPKVVHHVIVRVKYPAGYPNVPQEAYLFTSWVPGLTPSEVPAGTGLFVPKGAKFNFEMHYTTNGEAQTDLSEMGLYLAKEKPARQLEVRAAQTRDFEIPPGVQDTNLFCHYCFKKDTVLYDLAPHMHLRGSWFKFQLLYADGHRETLLSVPQYDFNWQTSYRLAEPKHVPAGTWMLCTGGHDNSKLNPNNPDPNQTVTWGLQSWDEMFMGFMTVTDGPMETAAR